MQLFRINSSKLSFLLFAFLLTSIACAALTVSNVTVYGITATSAVISWNTDVPSDSFVSYGHDGGLRVETGVLDSDGVTAHTVTLQGLWPLAYYTFVVRSSAKGVSAFFDATAGGKTFRMLAAPASGPPLVSLHVNGPQHVTQGFSQVFGIEQFQTSGNSSAVRGSTAVTTVTGLPPYTELHWPDQEFNGFPQNLPYDGKSLVSWGVAYTQFLLRTNKGGTTPVGRYRITVTTTFPSLPSFSQSASFDLSVDALPAFKLSPSPSPAIPAIPDLTLFHANMVTYGKKWCGTASMWDQSVSFYDGERTYRQLRDYDTAHNLTPDPSQWNACIAQAHDSYLKYVQPGAIQAIWNFPQGLYLAAQAGDAQSAAAVDILASRSNQAHLWASSNYAFDIGLMREDSYQLEAFLREAALGKPRTEQIEQSVDYLLAFIERITQNEENAGVFEPFMGGLMAEALITYYQATPGGDPRIPPAIQALADWMWSNVWNTWEESGAFVYQLAQYRMGLPEARNAPYYMELRGLNLLVAPMYAWLYHMGGGTVYQSEGDAIWHSGVTAAIGDTVGWSGKNFSQNYRWGLDYVQWRSPGSTASTLRNPIALITF